MAFLSFIRLLLLLLLLHSLLGVGKADDAHNGNLICNVTGNFTANSIYARNRGLLFSSLASNVTTNGSSYFYTTTVGQVSGLALCRPDSSSERCSNCVSSAIQDILGQCPNQKEAIFWKGDGLPLCMVRYTNHSIVGKLELHPIKIGRNINNSTSNMGEFDRIWSSFMNSLVAKASAGSYKLKNAYGEEKLTSFQNIYAYTQCVPDISQYNCSYCLQYAIGSYQNCCHGSQGGYVHLPSCSLRWDLYPFYNIAALSPPLAPQPDIPKGSGRNSSTRTIEIIVVPIVVFIAVVVPAVTIFIVRKRKREVKSLERNKRTSGLQFKIETIMLATKNFSDDNKIGQGGFGAVYKGILSGGEVVAVKRLSRTSSQGDVEFKNEVLLVSRLQHRNLVRLLGFCLEGHERLLIYEFMPNSSLDHYIFDPYKQLLLKWVMRYDIIVGIARGLVYLHEESQLRIIHRDLKASNILLDYDMNPKISDFGMARLFEMDQSHDAASRIVGTLGYMPPEYTKRGVVSLKSDVYSFGVLVLEIITGKKISCFYGGEEEDNLLTHVWKSWTENTTLNLIEANDEVDAGSVNEKMRCIQIGLLCVQENAAKRPTMGSVIVMLTSGSASIPDPLKPAYFMDGSKKQEQEAEAALLSSEEVINNGDQPKTGSTQFSINEISSSEVHPR